MVRKSDLATFGYKINAGMWASTAAHYGDTEGVVKDIGSSLTFAEQIVSEVNSLVVIIDNLKKQFELYYQPKVSLLTGKIGSVEALIRWIMDTAAEQAGLWKKQGLNLRIAINVTARLTSAGLWS